MRVISKDRLDRPDGKTAQDAPKATSVISVDLQVPPISRLASRERKRSCLSVIEHFRGDEDGVDAAVPVDAKNAPTSDLENCKERSFPQRPHRSLFSYRKRNNEERCKCANLIVSTEGFTPQECAQQCAQAGSDDHHPPANANQGPNKKRA